MKRSSKKALIDYRMKRCKETLNEVPYLIRKEFFQTSVNRIYYACFYSLNALLLKNDISAKTHSGVLNQFGLHFIRTQKISREFGTFYSTLFNKRMSGDYAEFIAFDKETVNDLYNTAKKFVSAVEDLI